MTGGGRVRDGVESVAGTASAAVVRAMNDALAALEPLGRQVVVLACVERMPLRAIAGRLAVPEPRVRHELAAGLRTIRSATRTVPAAAS